MDYQKLDWRKSVFAPPSDGNLQQNLAQALMKTSALNPDAPAIIAHGRTYSFRELEGRVAGMAEEIKSSGAGNKPIAILQSSGIDAVAVWFACAMAGKPFLLLEPDHPTERIRSLIQQAGCTHALVDQSTMYHLDGLSTIIRLVSDQKSECFAAGSESNASNNNEFSQAIKDGLDPEDLAMIFPTSGSTGKPKLICYSSLTIQAKVQSSMSLMEVPAGARVLIVGSHSNYGFMHHALVFLLKGGCVCLTDLKARGYDVISEAIDIHEVRHARFTPSLFRQLAQVSKTHSSLAKLQAVRFSGEPLLNSDLRLASSVLSKSCIVQNVYGSTESAIFIWSNTNEKIPEGMTSVPIGKIYPLSEFAIHSADFGDDPTGKGELLIKSDYHAVGDYENGELKSDRFPLFHQNGQSKVYHTGDLVQPLPDGNLLHLGRLGRMVKIRGHRVYLSEIEQEMRAVPGVSGSAVIESNSEGNIALHGFVCLDSSQTTPLEIVQSLKERLPDFMVPRTLQPLAEIPLMAGGKVDYKYLEKLVSNQDGPATKRVRADQRLVEIWDRVLWPGAHQINADFLSLGGDSIGFMTLLADIEDKLGIKIPSEEIRHNCTLSNLSLRLNLAFDSGEAPADFKLLKIKLYRKSEGPSKGVAIAVPGHGGGTHAYAFDQAGFFKQYDVWTVEMPLTSGHMLDNERWWMATQEIVELIRSGAVPQPDILFGYCFAGGLAWMVAKLLAGTQWSPKYVIMNDAPPLHRRYKTKDKVFKSEVLGPARTSMPSVLHLRRSSQNMDFSKDFRPDWQDSDQISKTVYLPTADHIAMGKKEILSLAKSVTDDFLVEKHMETDSLYLKENPKELSYEIYSAFQGNHNSWVRIANDYSSFLEHPKPHLMVSLAILFYRKGFLEKSINLIQIGLRHHPADMWLVYLKIRFKRKSFTQISSLFSRILPKKLIAVEQSLAQFEVHKKTVPLAHTTMLKDLLIAYITVKRVALLR